MTYIEFPCENVVHLHERVWWLTEELTLTAKNDFEWVWFVPTTANEQWVSVGFKDERHATLFALKWL